MKLSLIIFLWLCYESRNTCFLFSSYKPKNQTVKRAQYKAGLLEYLDLYMYLHL